MNFDVPYGITRRISGTTIAATRERVTSALKEEGFGVLTEIDVQSTLEKKLGVHTEPYVILGACNPKLAHEALTKEPAIGLLLPCLAARDVRRGGRRRRGRHHGDRRRCGRPAPSRARSVCRGSRRQAMSHSRRFDPAKLAKLDSPERRARMPHAAIVAALELEPHARIAAVAAGTGYVTFALLDGEVPPAIIHTIDVSGPMLGGAHATGQRVPLD